MYTIPYIMSTYGKRSVVLSQIIENLDKKFFDVLIMNRL